MNDGRECTIVRDGVDSPHATERVFRRLLRIANRRSGLLSVQCLMWRFDVGDDSIDDH